MPSKTPAQAKLMAIAAHTPGGYGGVPQSVGQEFHQADAGKKYGVQHMSAPSDPMKRRKIAAMLAARAR